MTRIAWTIFGALCFVVGVWVDVSSNNGRASRDLITSSVSRAGQSRTKATATKSRVRTGITRFSGLRYQNVHDSSRRKRKLIIQPIEDDNEVSLHQHIEADRAEFEREEVEFWNRALQDASFSLSISLSTTPEAYRSRFYRRRHHNRNSEIYSIRSSITEDQTYSCACNSRYGDWIEYRSGDGTRKLHEADVEGLENVSDNEELLQADQKNGKKELDFLVAGFPKCGTTTLLYAFRNHSETSISSKEHCTITKKGKDDAAYSKLDQALAKLPSNTKRGIKCPTALRNFKSLERLEHHSPNARIVIGVRHPVTFFESFYNYRVMEHNTKNSNGEKVVVPPIEDLVGSNEWQGVSTDNVRFETFLMQLGKTSITLTDMQKLKTLPNLAVKPFPFKVFLYALEQLEENDAERKTRFRQEMQQFLELEEPLKPFGLENKNHFVGDQAFPETIDICNDKYTDLRALLIRQGTETREWIRNSFVESLDVHVGNRHHFMELLDTWSADPCTSRVVQNHNQESHK